MPLSQLRRRVNALKRKLAPELAIIKLRRIAEAVRRRLDSRRNLQGWELPVLAP